MPDDSPSRGVSRAGAKVVSTAEIQTLMKKGLLSSHAVLSASLLEAHSRTRRVVAADVPRSCGYPDRAGTHRVLTRRNLPVSHSRLPAGAHSPADQTNLSRL